ncbi:MAG TPA: glycosyltransferase 87 family protein [Baekduia sp.]|uniref:glycosyltransferase 87 family protein n=1 Tax=Baekduia sp. TaxID=2600305 RepID=UPI002D7917F8|nr:glycosyltransferase 87 family protein [Baekduia sp.]HET6508798.1 glycosyltransferase 87 family protein [Baekduia sp.]
MSVDHGPFSGAQVSDLYLYGQYQHLLRDGLVPFRDFDFEYPPGALLPLWIAGGHAIGMSLLMLACALATQGAAWAIGGARAGWAMVALPPVAGALVRTHFDLFPVALALGGLALVVTRPRRGAVEAGLVLLALGTMTKLWPAAIAAVAVAWLVGRGETRLALRATAAFVVVVLVTGIPFAALGGFPSTMVRFHLDRPVQIESTAATVLEVVGGSSVTGDPIRHDAFKSNGLDGGAADLVQALSSLALVVAGLAVLWLARRRPTADALVFAALAITLAFVAFSKVLSPQYMVWLLPLAAVAFGRGARLGPALVALASLTTQLWFPARYFDVVYQHAWAVTAVGVRNVLLLAALAATARALARSPGPAVATPRSG